MSPGGGGARVGLDTLSPVRGVWIRSGIARLGSKRLWRLHHGSPLRARGVTSRSDPGRMGHAFLPLTRPTGTFLCSIRLDAIWYPFGSWTMSKSWCLLVLLCSLTSACASGPRASPPTQPAPLGGLASLGAIDVSSDATVVENTVPAAPEEVWLALPLVFEALEIEPVVVDTEALVMGNPEFTPRAIEGRRLSTYMDCGRGLAGPNADRYLVTVQWMVWLEGGPGGSTVVTTLLDAYARPRDTGGTAVHCVSRGALERRLAELITELAASAL